MSTDHWAIGIDLGGTKIEAALVNSSGQLRDRLRVPTESQQGYNAILKRLAETIHQLSSQNGNIIASAIGIGVAGQISTSSGIVHDAPNLKWHEVRLQDDLSAMIHKDVRVCNDVRAASWGEWQHGAGKNCNDFVCIFVGTGIGGSIVSGGQMLTGCNNTSGEIGHMTLDMHGPECHCGNKGCFEALAGGWAIERDARAFVQADMQAGKFMLALAENKIADITAITVAEAGRQHDALANSIIDNLGNSLIAGCASVVNAFGPCRLILGGGIIEGMPQLLDRIEKGIKQSALKAAIKDLEVLPATLHNDSGVIGAAAFAFNQLLKP